MSRYRMTSTWLALVAALALALPVTASAESSEGGDDANAPSAADDRPAWADLMPPRTMFAIRVDAAGFEDWWSQLQAGIERVGSSSGRQPPGFPARHRPSTLALSLLAGEFEDVFEGREPRLMRKKLEHLDDTRPMLLVMSTYGYGDYLEAVRAGVLPPDGEGVAHAGRGLPMRLLLGSKAPEKLAADIEAFCRHEMHCENLVRLQPAPDEKGYLAVDLMGTSGDSRKVAEETGWADPTPMFDPDHLGRTTPAALQFMHRPAGVSVYTTAEGLFAFGALAVGASRYYRYRRGVDAELERAASNEQALKTDRQIQIEYEKRRMYRGLRNSMAFRTLLAPEAREIEDLLIHSDATGEDAETDGMQVDVVQSFTGRGRAISRAGRLKLALPELKMRRPALQMAWTYNLKAALEAAVVPGWIERAAGKGHRKLEAIGELMEDTEVLGGLLLIAGHPFGVLKGGKELLDEMKLPVSGSDLAGMLAGRVWLDGRPIPQKQAQLPFQVFGGLSLAARAESKAPSTLRASLEMAGMAMQMPVFANTGETTSPAGTLQTMQLKLDRSGDFSEKTGDGHGQLVSMDVDFDRILARIEPMTASGFDLDDDPTEMMRFFRSLSIRSAEDDHGRLLRLHFGPGGAGTPARPSAHEASPAGRLAEVEKPAPIPACADESFRVADRFVAKYLAEGELWSRRSYMRAAKVAESDRGGSASGDGNGDDPSQDELAQKRAAKIKERLAEVDAARKEMVDELEAAARACEDAPQPWRGRVERAAEAWKNWEASRANVPMPEIYE